MALPKKPHTVQWRKRQNQGVAGRIEGSTWTYETSFAALVVPMRAVRDSDPIGPSRASRAVVLCELADSVGIKAGDQVVHGDTVWFVSAAPRRFESNTAASHARIELEARER